MEKANDRNLTLIRRAVARIKHNTKDLYVKPCAFDRWVHYTKMRKIVKHWL